MKHTIANVTFLCAMLAVTSQARAQDNRADDPPQGTVEITPYVSQGSATSSRFGAAVRWPVASDLSLELETGYRRGEMHALSSNVSLLYDLPAIGRLTPYLAGGLGLEQYGVAVESRGGGLVTLPKTAFTVNAGGGLRMPVSQNLGVRTDARWPNGLGRTAPERWRLYNGLTIAGGR